MVAQPRQFTQTELVIFVQHGWKGYDFIGRFRHANAVDRDEGIGGIKRRP
jgi:hypothetical protein